MAAHGVLGLLGPLALATLAGCGPPAATPVPAVTVHVVNRTSTVIVTGVSLHPEGGALGTAPLVGYEVVPPCGASIDVRATIGNLEGHGALGLAIDLDGNLDRDYASAGAVPSDGPRYGLTPFWSHGALREGEWITVTPAEVVRSMELVPPSGASGPCEPLRKELFLLDELSAPIGA